MSEETKQPEGEELKPVEEGSEETVTVKVSELTEVLKRQKETEATLKTLQEEGKKKEDTISNLMKRLSEVANTSSPTNLKQITEHTCVVRTHNGKVVIGFDNKSKMAHKGREKYVYEAPDPENSKEDKLYVDLLLEGVDKPVTVEYLEFLRSDEMMTVPIKKVMTEEIVKDDGVVEKTKYGEWDRQTLGYSVPLESVSVRRKFLVGIPSDEMGEARELVIDELFVNNYGA